MVNKSRDVYPIFGSGCNITLYNLNLKIRDISIINTYNCLHSVHIESIYFYITIDLNHMDTKSYLLFTLKFYAKCIDH